MYIVSLFNGYVNKRVFVLPGMVQIPLVAQQQRGEVRRQFQFAQFVQKVLRFDETRPVHHAVDDHERVAPSDVVEQTRCLRETERRINKYKLTILYVRTYKKKKKKFIIETEQCHINIQ